MPNLLLLCHGGLDEFGSFDVQQGSTVQYRGNFGTNLSGPVARTLVSAILDNPTVTDVELKRSIDGYDPQEPLDGPGTFRPNIRLSGSTSPFCFVMNLSTRQWVPLDGTFKTTLKDVVRSFAGHNYWLNLLCCTNLKLDELPRATINDSKKALSWDKLL